ncbi:hypothetical protein MIR68_004983 [Amoeboaphelidium protococcarum]|nr:hypothetical protein MIR68_004983 [Amoeboaphelidium protococcarum]
MVCRSLFDIDPLQIACESDNREQAQQDKAPDTKDAQYEQSMPVAASQKSCRICNQSFYTSSEQRVHFQTEEHQIRLKQSVQDSISDDDNDDEEESDGDFLHQQQRSAISFTLKFGQEVHVYKSVFFVEEDKDDILLPQQLIRFLQDSRPYWCILLLQGGRFAGALFDLTSTNHDLMVMHKTIVKYTTRRKQGGSQKSKDNSTKGIKSAGAQIRRQNQVALEQEVRSVLSSWSPYLLKCRRIFVHAPGPHNKAILYNPDNDKKVPPLIKTDSRIASIPLNIHRPTLEEIIRINAQLQSINQ